MFVMVYIAIACQKLSMEIPQNLTSTEQEILKQSNGQTYISTYNSQDDGSFGRHEDNDNDDGRETSCNKKDEARLFYGKNETQVSEGGETDLHKHLVDCKKNPGHTQFVPVNDFNVHHLPEGYHDNDLVEFIKAAGDLTVRLGVKMTSTERPEFWPNTTVPYAFRNMRGSHVMRVGTGKVKTVNKRYNMGPCQCHKCQHSDTPSNSWGEVGMYTATHVVFDGLEAKHTTCRMFFDRQDSPLVTLEGWTVGEANIGEDSCWLTCVTCDVELLDKLYKMVGHWRNLWKKVNNKYESSGDKGTLSFIVSHPHGCHKQVSVGHWIHRHVVWDIWTKYTYTTCTCPGSSGAHVHSLGCYSSLYWYGRHIHSGVNSEGNNFSGVGLDML